MRKFTDSIQILCKIFVIFERERGATKLFLGIKNSKFRRPQVPVLLSRAGVAKGVLSKREECWEVALIKVI